MSLWSFGVRRPVVANLYAVGVIVAGVIFGSALTREFFPEVRPTEVVIAAPYPGAAPDEVEATLARKIEDAVADLRNVKELNTTVTEGLAVVRIEFDEGVAIESAVAEVKRKMDALQDLPERSERIIVDKFEPNIPVIQLSIYGDLDERVMKDAARVMRDDLRSIPGMGDVLLIGVRRDELSVEVRPGALVEHGLGIQAVADRVRQAMTEVPAGTVRTATANVPVRTLGAEERARAVREIVVKAAPGGQVVRLGEIAEVREGFEDADILTRLNNQRAATLTIFKVGRDDAVQMAEIVKAYAAGRLREPLVPNLRERLRMALRAPGDEGPVSPRMRAYELGLSRPPPPGELAMTTDLARFITQRLDLLTRNAMYGAALVFLTLLLFLNLRASFWVCVGLVVAICGTLVVMRVFGLTLNLLSMFGLIIVIGLLVDDGIVVAENIVAKHDAGMPAEEAAIEATGQVAWPVVGTVLTTICAFLPLLLIEGRIGDLLGALPLVVACALGVSLVECLFGLPKHMAHSLARADRRQAGGRLGPISRLEARFDGVRDRSFERWIAGPYTAVLGRALAAPWLSLAIAIAVLILSLGVVAGGRLPFLFFDVADSETVVGDLRMPIGTPIEQTDAVVRRLEVAALSQPEVQSVYAVVGYTGDLEGGSEAVQSHLAQLFIELRPVEDREAEGLRQSTAVTVAIRQAAGELTGVKSLRLEGIQGGPAGPPITFTVVGEDPDAMAAVTREIEERLEEFEGVYDIANDADAGQRELRFRLRPGASELGFTTTGVATQVRGAIHGLEAYTFAGDREDVDVRVRLQEGTRRSLAAVERLHLFTPEGRPVPLGEVVEIEEGQGYATVRRLDRRRAVTVTADVDAAVANTELIAAAMRPVFRELEHRHAGTRILERGRQKDVSDSFRTLPLGMLTALGLNYIILAWLLSSYVQPLLIMAAIPFALIGMIWGHVVMGYSLQMLSLIGFVALSGIVVNDSIVFMKFFNTRIAGGGTVREAAFDTGRARLRAILLTTLTTMAGLGPLMLEQSFQARILIPMAVTIVFGLMASTLIVLLALPCLLVVADQVRRGAVTVWTGSSEPAA